MATEEAQSRDGSDQPTTRATSELNNILQIISGTTELIENIWSGSDASGKYFAMLRESIGRAEKITEELVRQAGGASAKVLMHPELAAMVRSKAPPAPPSPAKKRVLIVDDEEMMLSLMKTILEDAGIKVTTARSGFQCLDLIGSRHRHFDLILLDLSMPLMDGEETFGRIRALFPDARVVLSTGFVDQARLDRMSAAGLTGLLRKPQSATNLVAYVNLLLESGDRLRANQAATGTATAPSESK